MDVFFSLVKEMNRLMKQINRLLSKGMSNKVTIEKVTYSKFRFSKFKVRLQVNC